MATNQDFKRATFDRLGPAALRAGAAPSPLADFDAEAPAAAVPGKDSFLKMLGQSLLESAIGALPQPGGGNLAGASAAEFSRGGGSNIESALFGSLIGGPIAARQQNLQEKLSLQNAAAKRLGLDLREEELLRRALATPGGAGGEIEVGGEKVAIPAQETRSAVAEAAARAATGQVGARTTAARTAERPFEAEARARKEAQDAQENARKQAAGFDASIKDFGERYLKSTKNLKKGRVSAQNLQILKQIRALEVQRQKLEKAYPDAQLPPASGFIQTLPSDVRQELKAFLLEGR